MQRRSFIRQSCGLCMAIAGSTSLVSLLNSCTPLPMYKTRSLNGEIKIPLSEFAQTDYVIIRPDDVDFDIAVVKTNTDAFKALVMLCTHADNRVQFNGNEFRCNLHGSMFDRLGKVEKGPAAKPLKSLLLRKENEKLVITLS